MVIFLIFTPILKECSVSENSVEPDQTPLSAASDLGLHCFSAMSHRKKDARLIWVKPWVLNNKKVTKYHA